MAWQGIEAPKKKTIEFPAAPSFSSKKWIKLIPKTIGNRKKRLCVRLRSGDKHHLRKSADRKAQIRKAFVPLTGLICAFRYADFLRWCLSPERNLAHNLFFLFPIVFGIIFFSAEHFSRLVRTVTASGLAHCLRDKLKGSEPKLHIQQVGDLHLIHFP